MYIYIYIYMCVCVCVCVYIYICRSGKAVGLLCAGGGLSLLYHVAFKVRLPCVIWYCVVCTYRVNKQHIKPAWQGASIHTHKHTHTHTTGGSILGLSGSTFVTWFVLGVCVYLGAGMAQNVSQGLGFRV
jgi:hypothetical protein